MKSFEFILDDTIDVLKEARISARQHEQEFFESGNDTEQLISNFIDSLPDAPPGNANLINGELYWPLFIRIGGGAKMITIRTVVGLVEFAHYDSGYNYFTYKETQKTIKFPTDDVLLDPEYVRYYRGKEPIDQILVMMKLMFSTMDQWVVDALAFDETGTVRRIDNL